MIYMLKRMVGFGWKLVIGTKSKPKWVNEFFLGSFRALVGIEVNEVGGVHYVTKLQRRGKDDQFKDMDSIRSYEWPQVQLLMGRVEAYATSMPSAG